MTVNASIAARPTPPEGVAAKHGRSSQSTQATALYILVLAVVVVLAAVYSQRHDGIFACGASGYGTDRYLAYCQATSYGDYDHGAFWFGLEPATAKAATEARVLVIGNSRTQIGFSTSATADWFSAGSVPFYLLGFSHNGNVNFEGPLLARLGARPTVLVVNTDLFFEPKETSPAGTVMHDAGAQARYRQKQLWQRFHRSICTALPIACSDEPAFYRSRPTGLWVERGGQFSAAPVSYDSIVDQEALRRYTPAATRFLAQLPLARECVILTIVPTVKTGLATARALASSLGVDLVAPELDGLATYDASHLDQPSAERWSAAFFEAAGPRIRHCLDRRSSSASAVPEEQ